MGMKTRAGLALAAVVAATAGRSSAETTVTGTQGPSSSQTSYVVPVAPGVRAVAIMTTGDSVNPKLDNATPYRLVGIPDGMGGIDGDDGTLLATCNHEINANSAVSRAHGSAGAFVSAIRIDRTTLAVRSGYDLIRTVETWNAATQVYVQGTTSFDRFCSADVPAVSAFHDPVSGLGTTERFHMNGEESGAGRAWAHQITGVNAGVSWELPKLGKQGWENIVACPTAQVKTVVACNDDTTPGQVLIYVGTKLAAGTDVQKAGLTNGTVYGVVANGARTESRTTGIGLAKGVDGAFTMVALPDQAASGANTESAADSAGVTEFLRPEDGAWDPLRPGDFYFVTTDGALPSGRSRLWRLRFSDIANPAAGGAVTMLLEGTEGGDMFDNIAIDRLGHVILQEDLGGNAKSGKIWQYDVNTTAFTLLAKHDPARFGDSPGGSPVSPFNNDEESTGIFDASEFLGPGWFVFGVQAHYSISGELFQGGQLLALFNPDSVGSPSIVTAATATPSSVLANQPVAFHVKASVLGDGVITYSWNFGDGTSAPGQSVSHSYMAAGTYTATATATHAASGKTATSSVQVDVGRAFGLMDVTVNLIFSQTGKDRLVVNGEVPIPAGFVAAGKQISINCGGVVRTFTMDANGAASPNANELFRMTIKKNADTSVPAQRAFFDMTLQNQDLRPAFADEGFTNRNATNEPGSIVVSVTFGGRTQQFVREVVYNSALNAKGLAR
jgi:PKD repeat protein